MGGGRRRSEGVSWVGGSKSEEKKEGGRASAREGHLAGEEREMEEETHRDRMGVCGGKDGGRKEVRGLGERGWDMVVGEGRGRGSEGEWSERWREEGREGGRERESRASRRPSSNLCPRPLSWPTPPPRRDRPRRAAARGDCRLRTAVASDPSPRLRRPTSPWPSSRLPVADGRQNRAAREFCFFALWPKEAARRAELLPKPGQAAGVGLALMEQLGSREGLRGRASDHKPGPGGSAASRKMSRERRGPP